MISTPKLNVALKLTGEEFSPSEATRMIGLNPTRTWVTGALVERTKLKRKNCGWEFALPYRKTHHMEAVLIELLDIVEPHKQKIIRLVVRLGLTVDISLGVYIREGDMPASWFGANTLRRLTAIGANLDIDLIATK